MYVYTYYSAEKSQWPGVKLSYPVPWGYKYWGLALQVRGVSDETQKYGYGF
jgi:hypothetical protein